MQKDVNWAMYFEKPGRVADLINSRLKTSTSIVTAEDVRPYESNIVISKDAKTKAKRMYRDVTRKVAFGVNFCIVDLENQETVDYSFPLRDLEYTTGEYSQQARGIRRMNKEKRQMNIGEYLYHFNKEDKMIPVVVFLIYSGIPEWDGAKSIREMLDMNDIPREIGELVQDHKINLIDIRRMSDEEISTFQTDVGKVFDFIRASEDKNRLMRLVEEDTYFQNMEKDAYDVINNYANIKITKTEKYRTTNGGYDMCTAIKEMIEDVRMEYQDILNQKDEEISQKDEEISQKDEEISQKDEEISQKDEEINQKDEEISRKDKKIAELERQLQEMRKALHN